MLPAYATNTQKFYARIMQEGVILYKSPIDVLDTENVFFELPRTYFVELIDSANQQFFMVNYMSFTGYVKKECVQTIVGTPKKPFLTDISFRIYAEPSRDMRSEPTTSGGSLSQVTYIPLMSKNLTFIGKITGEELVSGRTDIWYYCKYSADRDYYGYVYSDFCDQLTPILDNTESVTYTSSPVFSTPQQQQTAIPLTDKTTGIIIAILFVPAGIFAFMILKNKKILKQEKIHSKEVVDY